MAKGSKKPKAERQDPSRNKMVAALGESVSKTNAQLKHGGDQNPNHFKNSDSRFVQEADRDLNVKMTNLEDL